LAQYDVIIIGAGHNGLVTAAYLAQAGRRVLVLEKRDTVGGAAVSEEIFPGFKISTVADGCGYLSAKVRRELKLDAHVEMVPSDVVAFCPQPDGTQLTIWRDTQRTAEEIARFSKADAEEYPKFVELMSRIADVVGGLMELTPPDLPEISLRDLLNGAALLGPVRRLGRKRIPDLLRILPMPSADLLNEFFEAEAVRGAIGASSVLNITWGPQENGTAYTLLSSWAQSGTGLFRSAGVVKGGMGALTGALADAVVSNADPRTTFYELLEPHYFDTLFMRQVENIKYRGSAARIHLALRALPEFTALAGSDATAQLSGPIQIAPSLDYVQKAFDCTKYGEYSRYPYLDLLIPTLSDPSLAPAGQHILSITAKYAPYELDAGDWSAQKQSFADVVIDTLAEYAPNIRDVITDRHVLSPSDLESLYGLPEGNPNHGEMTLEQFFHMRPIPSCARYRTPIAGMYLCGAGAHPGGGVTGIPGHNAAREILKDSK